MRHLLYFGLLALFLAALIHLFAVMALPALATKTAWHRIEKLGPANTLIQLPPATPKEAVLPMMAPDIRYAACRFDLAEGPVRLNAKTDSDLWLVAFYSPDGANFYTVGSADLKRRDLKLIVATADQNVIEEGVDAPEGAEQVAVVRSPETEGIALIRAPIPGPSYAARADTALKAASCHPYQAPR
ncbi:DUF1254 domain-containing protein [Methyloligella sp. 2.7D]|uniref:DUF1254 domain-containing protein n=1 Tax=unclassified Methyloligella TaxID=2625955 RepID=UPI00157C5006|nr:DUF1254 domain-containing protein [Methyloligella sp. GL2]QKP77099.1 DUF1254 domain-containing protein [Methyloligella sp. GL2]